MEEEPARLRRAARDDRRGPDHDDDQVLGARGGLAPLIAEAGLAVVSSGSLGRGAIEILLLESV